MEKKKILMVTASLDTGGAEKLARDIALCGPRNWEFHFLVFEEAGAYEAALTAAGCRIIRMPRPGRNYAAHVCALTALLRREGYGIVHSHTMFHCGWVMAAAKHADVPVRIAYAHSELQEGGAYRRVYEWLMGILIRRCATDRIACSAGAGRRLFGAGAFRIIPNGIHRAAFSFDEDARSRIRRQLGWENCHLIGHTGRLNRVKNQIFLIRRMPELLKKRPDARLLLLGEGEDRERLEQEIARLGLENYVQMPGNREDPGPYYSAMDLFAFPSLYEGMPLALLEARCSGLHCVVSHRVACPVGGITRLPLDCPEAWVQALGEAHPRIPGSVPDLEEMLAGIYAIYEREEHDQDPLSHRESDWGRRGSGPDPSGKPAGPGKILHYRPDGDAL